MVILLALLGAVAFAFGSVLQQKGTLEAPAAGDDPRFLVQILKRPVWLAGGGLQATGWVLQAAALDRGSLVVVQSITATSLVIALPLGAHFTHQEISRRVVAGAVAIIVGIVLFLSVGTPQKGISTPGTAAWVSAGVVGTGLIALLAHRGQRRSGAPRAMLFGSAAGVGFALQATVTKEFTSIIGSGVGALLSSWEAYALAASAIVGFVLQQSALKTGVLAPAMASSNAVTLFASIVFGVTVFGERLTNGSSPVAPAIIGLVVALIGIVLLTGSTPPQPSPANPLASQASPQKPDEGP
jgi:drug/metabolite transporter (DMT)-like permease